MRKIAFLASALLFLFVNYRRDDSILGPGWNHGLHIKAKPVFA